MKQSCLPCKQKHLRCDRRRPVCTRCANTKTKVKCFYPAKFRQRSLAIVGPSHEVSFRFVNVSPDGNPEPSPDNSSSAAQSPVNQLPGLDASEGRPSPPTDPPTLSLSSKVTQPEWALPCPASEPSLSSPGQFRPLSHHSHEEFLGEPPTPTLSPEKPYSTHLQVQLPAVANPHRICISEDEYDFFQFYLEHSGVWLDIVSSDRLFSQTVPRLALHKPTLYHACLAYAAHVMALWGSCDQAIADYFHNRVITHLIYKLDLESQLPPPEDLVATIVILRMLEQYSEPEQDVQCHLNGAYSLLTSTKFKWSPDDISLKGTAFWTFVRQTLRICFLSEKQCGFDLGIVEAGNMTYPAGDQVWTNRMTYLSAQVCNACWWSPPLDNASRDRLLDAIEIDIDSWRASVPESFKPWYYHHPTSDPFPTIRYLNSWHAIAWQQYYTTRTMLAVYHRKPQAPVSYRDISNYVNSKILVPARLACGVVISESNVGCGINGAHLAYWCGQFFMGREEQSKLLDWLGEFMQTTKWPNRACITRLEKSWGFTADKSTDCWRSPPSV